MIQSGHAEIPIFIVEDHDAVRGMLGKLIARAPGLVLCGEAASAEAALAQISTCNPRLVLVDVSLPGKDGIELIRLLHERDPDLLTLAISGHDETIYAEAALQAGARGYIMKGKLTKVAEAIRHVCNGGIYVNEAMRDAHDDMA